MRKILILLPLALAACQTPREACISGATRQLSIIEGLIAETQGNLARGYAIDTRQEVRVRPDTCTIQLPDGTEGRVRCEDTTVVDIDVPVAIDLRAEQAKLDSLLEQRARLQSQTQDAVQSCIAIHPE